MKPYTYLLGWPNKNKWYYGVRYAKNCQPNDLWVSYKTSSKHVKKFVSENGEPSIIEIRKIFSSDVKAREWEHKVLRRIKAASTDFWLNKTDNKSIAPLYGDLNPAKRPEVRKKISENTPKKYGLENPMSNPEVANKVSKKLKGRRNYWQEGDKNPAKRADVRKKLSRPGKLNPFYNRSHSEEFKKNAADRLKGIPKEKVTCDHCGKIGGKNAMFRWHFENCKFLGLNLLKFSNN